MVDMFSVAVFDHMVFVLIALFIIKMQVIFGCKSLKECNVKLSSLTFASLVNHSQSSMYGKGIERLSNIIYISYSGVH